MSQREDKSAAVIYPTVYCVRANKQLPLERAREYFMQPLCAQSRKACPHHCACQGVRRANQETL